MQAALKQLDFSSELQPRQVLAKALQRLQEEWALSNAQMAHLIRVKPNTYGYWMQKAQVPFQAGPLRSEMELVIALIAIFRSLGAMFVAAADQQLWLKSPHPHFGEQSPLDFAKHSSENLFYLRQYLDYIRGRGA